MSSNTSGRAINSTERVIQRTPFCVARRFFSMTQAAHLSIPFKKEDLHFFSILGTVAILLFLLLSPHSAAAQYYDWGRSPQNIRFMQSKTASGSIIYPHYFGKQAALIAAYLDTLSPHITYGFSQPPISLPIVLHTQNSIANGMVMWAPKRMELEMIPEQYTYALPWAKQLAVHEYRHAVQYGNLYQGWMRPLGWFLGQHAGLISAAMGSIWFLEGDATMAETQFSPYGRALQPSFTLAYRGIFTPPDSPNYRVDKWFCGSYKHYIPNHYKLGYQMVAWARETYGDLMWEDMLHYSAHKPYMIMTTRFALRKYYKTSTTKMFRSTFFNLQNYWRSLPQSSDSSTPILTPTTSYTTYEAPMPLPDGSLVAFKSDLDRADRLVKVDPCTGAERRLTYTGSLSTLPTYADGKIYWTEFRRSLLWEQRVTSKICSYDLTTGRKHTVRQKAPEGHGPANRFFVTPLPSGELTAVAYDYRGNYRIDFLTQEGSVLIPDTLSVHGMAYDPQTATLAIIGLSDAGMGLYQVHPWNAEVTPLTAPSYSTLSHLRAGGGRLSFHSIQSGKDEVHLYDLVGGEEYRLSSSQYGSCSPSVPVADLVDGSERLFFTTYSPQGYHLAHQKIHLDSLQRVEYSRLPNNVVNPPRRKWDVPDISRVKIDLTTDTLASPKRYRRAAHMFRPHSWLPIGVDLPGLIDENRVDVSLGATLMSQDLLSTTMGSLTYGYAPYRGNTVRARLLYGGWVPKFDLQFAFVEKGRVVYRPAGVTAPARGSHTQLNGSIYLPLTLSSGAHSRSLVPRLELMYLNAEVYDRNSKNFSTGLARFSWGVTYNEQARMAHRDFVPRWGYTVKVAGVTAPFRNDFGQLYSVYGHVMLPGMALHHSLMVRGNVQRQFTGGYNFYYKELYPRGARYDIALSRMSALSVDYQLPLFYPDWGIPTVIYVNRVRLRGFYDYADFNFVRLPIAPRSSWVSSYGAELTLDFRIFRMPVNDTSFGLCVYRPSDQKGVTVGVKFSLPL